jgi:hypothetical protein
LWPCICDDHCLIGDSRQFCPCSASRHKRGDPFNR